jgi:diaminobutyrate-2-oxoglutarate transaminase
MPFSDNENSLLMLQNYLENCIPMDIPAAIILETIQAEGGIKVASQQWLEDVANFAKNNGILLIIDDIQTGCGRTGHFFSFETYNLEPDIICLSKSLSGYGFPLSMNLIRPEIDCWEPGEHTGTFRGNNLAFLAGNSILNYWENNDLSSKIIASSRLIEKYFQADEQLKKFNLRGRGLMRGIQLKNSEEAAILQKTLFKNGILMDICGYDEDVIKIMPPINISEEDLLLGLEIINKSIFEYETNN